MADPLGRDKLEERVRELEAEAAEIRAENHSLHEQLAARDQVNAGLVEFAKRGWARVAVLAERESARAGQAAADTVRTVAARAGAERDDYADVREILEGLCATVIEVAAKHDAPELAAECRWLRQALAERWPFGDVLASGMMMCWHWRGLEVRDQKRSSRFWSQQWEKLNLAIDDVPKKLGAMKRGKTKVDPDKVRARHAELIREGKHKQTALMTIVEEFNICGKTARGYLGVSREN
jgi:hypothetical protein